MTNQDLGHNLALLGAMVDQLASFLAGDDLTRKIVVEIGGHAVNTTMSLGIMVDLVEALDRAAAGMLPSERQQLDGLVSRLEAVRATHARAYADKLGREVKSHLDAWEWFLDGCERGDDSCFDDYASEVWRRTRIQQLLREARALRVDDHEARTRLEALDGRLDAIIQFGDYCGPRGEADAYPRETCWWLYCRPVRDEDYY
jgi:hypothetical protein